MNDAEEYGETEKTTLGYLDKTRAIHFSSIKDINYSKIANLIYAKRSISRAEIARQLNISKTTVTSVARELIADRIIRETGKGESQKGRRPLQLEFNERYKLVVGLEVGTGECAGIVTDLYAQPAGKPVFSRYEGSFERTVTAILGQLVSDYSQEDVIGVSIGVPGIYDSATRSIRVSESLGLANFSVQDLQQRIQFPVQVINRANAAALGEKWYGLGKSFSNLVYVYIGEGIGSGIIIRDELYEGSTGSAGELGHTIVLPYGPLCRCGSYGCLECLVSERILLDKASELARHRPDCVLASYLEKDGAILTLPLLGKAISAGDKECRKLINQQADYIALALANCANLIDPELIIIGGDMATALGELLIAPIRESVRNYAPYFAKVQIKLSQLGPIAVAVGACAHLLRQRFTS